MRRLKRIPVFLAWIVVGAAFFLLVLEESGVLVDLVRTRLAHNLGPLGDGLTIQRVSLRWFEPGIVIEDLRLEVPVSDDLSQSVPESADPEMQELIHLREAGISFGLERVSPLERLHVTGGRIRISGRLLQVFDAVVDSLAEGQDEGRREFAPPPFAVRDFDADLELPDGTTLQLGRATILAAPDEDGHYRLRGRLTPVLSGLVSSPRPIFVDGRQDDAGLSIRTAAQGLPFQSRSFERPPSLEALPIEEFSGVLTLEASARVDWGGDRIAVTGDLRAQLAEGRILPRVGAPLLEAVRCDVDVDFDLASGRRLWDRDLWSAKVELGAQWLGTPLAAWGQFGRDLPENLWAHAWARLPELRLDRELLEILGARELDKILWDSLAPEGTAIATVDLRVPPPTFEAETPHWGAPSVAVDVTLDGAASMSYVGFPDPEGHPRGIPIPVDDVRGRVLVVADPALDRFLRMALSVDGNHGSGRAWSKGMGSTPKEAGVPWTFDLEIGSDSLVVDDTLRKGLDGHLYTKFIWPEYQPQGGRVGFLWRLYEDPSTKGLAGSGDVFVDGVRFKWRGLPIPFEKTAGELAFRWSKLSAWRSEDLQQGVRPFGLRYELSNEAATGAGKIARAKVVGFVRDEFTRVDSPEDVPEERTQGLSIELDELLLRGRDWDAVSERFPPLAAEVDDLNAKGGVHVRFEGGKPAEDFPYRTAVEVEPKVVELSPVYFQRRTRDLAGRILMRSEEVGDGEDAIEASLILKGRWPGDVELACSGELYAGLPSRITIHGAGADPMNTSFRGALFSALSEGETSGETIDMSDRALEGRIDFSVLSEMVPSSEVEPNNLYRVFLRDNVLENASLRLEDLHGVLEQRGTILSSPNIKASLAGHPIELRDVNVFQLGDAAQLPIADPVLLRPTFWSDANGYALQADLFVLNLPLDESHLSSLLDEETLTVFRESPDWRGQLDVDGARIVVTSEEGDQGKVAVRGNVEPHDLAMSFGLPIEVPRAKVAIEEMIFEAGRVRGWGRAEELTASFFDRRLSEARMLFSYVDGRMSIDNLAGNFEGGRLESLGGDGQGTRKALAFDLAAPYHFDLAIRMSGVEVASLLEGVFQSSIADAGLIDGGLRLSGTPRNVLGITGGGWLHLDEGRLWSIPVMRELFLQLGADKTAVFDRLRSHFEVKNGRIVTSELKLRSNILSLVGAGSVDFDGTLSYDLEARYSLLDRLGVLNRLLYWLNNSLWRVAVRGDMARPRVKIRNSILEFLKSFDETPPRELPLPDFTAFPERF